jgi:hypothetical protein
MIIEGRINWARNLFTPTAPPGVNATPKYKCDIIVPKEDPVVAVLMEKVQGLIDKDLKGVKPTGHNWPFKDGDNLDGEHFKGCLVFSASNRDKVQVVDSAVQEIIDPSKVKSGDYCKFDVEPWSYSNVAKGISVSLNAVQVVAEGDAIGPVRKQAIDLFEAVGPAPKGELARDKGDSLDAFLES